MRSKPTAGLIAVVTAIGCASLAGAAAAPSAAASSAAAPAPAALVSDPTTLVNPFIGTSNGGDMFPGAAVPFGMLSFSPDTSSRPASGGYDYNSNSAIGLSVTHLSGAGCPVAGDLPILPTVGSIGTNPVSTTDSITHAHEHASPGYYANQLGSGGAAIGTRVSATARTGIGAFRFPATTAANFLFKAGDSQTPDAAETVNIVGNNELTGSITTGHFCAMQNSYTLHFAVIFSRPFTSFGTWQGATVSPGSATATGASSGGWVTFDTTSSRQVQMKVAISYVSTANAWANLRAEDPGWNLQTVASQAHQTWQQLLSEISVGGGTRAGQATFYTALYHALLDPSVFSDDNGQYAGFDGKVHTLPQGQVQYSNFSGWDIYRSEVPLLAMLAPRQTSQMMQSLVNDAQQGGWLPKWPVANGYTGMMNGDSADPIIAEAYAFGARDFNAGAALAAMVKGATVTPTTSQLGQGYYQERPQGSQYQQLGYVPNTQITSGSATTVGASETLEYATDDFAISQLAAALGQQQTARRFLGRSQNWTSLYNVDSGFIQPRDASGNFPAGNPDTTGLTNIGQSGFQEGTAGQYSWMVPQDIRGIISAMGGNATVDARLDKFFTHLNAGPSSAYYYAGDETDLGAPWVYDYAGQPYKTQSVVHRVLTGLYGDRTNGQPGNDDLGSMSSWYVWGALGMYPATPGTPVLALSSPMFPAISLHLPGGQATISAPGAPGLGYIQGMTVNGRPFGNDWLPAAALTGNRRSAAQGPGVSIDYALASQPSTTWASAPRQEPPSYQAGALKFPQGQVPAALTTSPATTTVTAGSQTTSKLTFDIGAGSENPHPTTVKSITWKAAPPAGITVTPASGTIPVGPRGRATTTVTFSAASNVTQGFDTVPISITSSPSVPLPALAMPLDVIGTGNTATTCTTLGSTNTDKGLQQVEESGDGATTPVTVGGESGRETVQVVANDLNMYFLVDPRIANNGTFTATFTVTYYDSGTNSWTLQYDSQSNAYAPALTVTEQGTNTWKTATVTVNDARFGGGENGGTDFRIASGSPVTIHGVGVTVSGTGVLPMSLCPGGS